MVKKAHSPEFKARVALEALKELRMANQIASDNGINPSLVCRWKSIAEQNLHQLFVKMTEADKQKREYEAKLDELYKQIGRLQVELDWIKKKYPQ